MVMTTRTSRPTRPRPDAANQTCRGGPPEPHLLKLIEGERGHEANPPPAATAAVRRASCSEPGELTLVVRGSTAAPSR